MNIRNLILSGAALLLASPVFATTYFGGYEDTTHGDYDYNDIVFSISGSNLTLKTSDGAWYSNPVVNNNGVPFWDHQSADGGNKNIGYCIYGGGDCGSALAPGAQYLASKSSPGSSANSVYFSVAGSVGTDVVLKIAALNDVLGWINLNTGAYGYINPQGATGTFSFNPGSNFELFGATYSNGNYSNFSYSDCAGTGDPSRFAFFAPTPEPGTMGAMAGGLIALGAIARRRKAAAKA